ncbi:zinc finger, CCHC-type containing protein [Tanacetum coccineum]
MLPTGVSDRCVETNWSAEQVVAEVMPRAVETAWDSTEASMCMDKNHSNFKVKSKTLCATRNDMKDRTTKYKSTMKQTMDDWFHRVTDLEKLAQELESCFSEIKETSAWTHVFSRTKLSRKMTSMCSDIDELVAQSKELGDTLVHKVAERVLMVTTPDISYITSQQDVLNQILQHLPYENYRAIKGASMSGDVIAERLKVDMEGATDVRLCSSESMWKVKPQLDRFGSKPLEHLECLEELIIDVDSEVQDWCFNLIEDLVEKISALPSVISFQCCLNDIVIDVIQVVDTVKIYMPKEHHLKTFLRRRQDLETHSFQVYIGCLISEGINIPEFYRYDRYVKYYNGTGHNDVINKVLTKVEAFELIHHNDIEQLSGNVIESMDYVQGCLIESCYKMRAIVGSDCSQVTPLLPNLERLYAKNLPKLENIWEGHMQLGSLSKLTRLVLCKCPMMTGIFQCYRKKSMLALIPVLLEDCCGVERRAIPKLIEDDNSVILWSLMIDGFGPWILGSYLISKRYASQTEVISMYALHTPIPDDGGDDATMKETRKKIKFENDDYVCRGLILNVYTTQMNMDEAISVSCFIDKLPHSWKDFKHTLKHKKEELTLVELGSHLRIEESLRAQEIDEPKRNNVVGSLVVNMVEHNNSTKYNGNKGKRKHHDNTKADPSKKSKLTCWKCGKTEHLKRDCKGVKVGIKTNGLGTSGSRIGSNNPLKGQNMFNKSFHIY